MTEALWKPVRWVIRRRFSRAARQVFLSRDSKFLDGLNAFSSARKIAEFIEALEAEASRIRPIAHLGDLPNVGSRLMVELAIYTAAAYRSLLERGLEKSQARGTVHDIGWVVYSEMLRLTSSPFRLASRNSGKRLRGTIGLLLRFPFKAPGSPGYAVEVKREGEDILTYWTHCPPQSFVRRLIAEDEDLGDLDAFYESWCQYDWPGADLIAGDGMQGHYERRKTLSRGDPVCDMCWKAKSALVR